MPGHGTRARVRARPPTNGSPLIEPSSLFSAPEGAERHHAASPSLRPATQPFQAPDFGEDETAWDEDAQIFTPDAWATPQRSVER